MISDTWISEHGRIKHRDKFNNETEYDIDQARALHAGLEACLDIASYAPRRIVQISAAPTQTDVLCNDGTAWFTDCEGGEVTWKSLPPIPQPDKN